MIKDEQILKLWEFIQSEKYHSEAINVEYDLKIENNKIIVTEHTIELADPSVRNFLSIKVGDSYEKFEF